MKAEEILRTAADLVSGPRKEQHGEAGQVFHQAALAMRLVGFGTREAVMFMVYLKIARMKNGAFNIDDYIDACGYIALAGQIESESEKITWAPGVPSK